MIIVDEKLTSVAAMPDTAPINYATEEIATLAPVIVFKDKRQKKASILLSKSVLPKFILNEKKKSSAYYRRARSSDIYNVKNAPIATRLIYNWKPLERQPCRVVQAQVKIYKPPKRIDMVARPPSPYRVKSDWESSEAQFHNEKRTLEMKRLEYLRQHTDWAIPWYGDAQEREEYK
jgi:hypothetical protein